ncbi:hypothetical protein JTB14_035206, partial [Gonioctena quinquepunctata]
KTNYSEKKTQVT